MEENKNEDNLEVKDSDVFSPGIIIAFTINIVLAIFAFKGCMRELKSPVQSYNRWDRMEQLIISNRCEHKDNDHTLKLEFENKN